MNQTNSQSDHQPEQGAPRDERQETTPMNQWPWLAQLFFALVIIVAVVVLLVGLPTASLLVAERIPSGSDGGSLRGVVSFWGAMFAAFISMTTVFIAAVFAFTALKVESGARFEARKGVNEELEKSKKKIQQLEERIKDKAESFINKKADAFVNKNGQRITKDVSYDYIYVKDNGARITRDMAKVYICDKDNGALITRSVAREYVNDNGAGITREVVENYVQEDTDGMETTRLEKITRETVENISAEYVTGLVNERLSSLGFFEKFEILFLRRHDRPVSPDKGQS